MTRRARPNGAQAAASAQATTAGVEGEMYKAARSSAELGARLGAEFAAGGGGSSASRAGIQGRAPGKAASPPLRSMTVAPAFCAAAACLTANAGEPAKNTKRVLSK